MAFFNPAPTVEDILRKQRQQVEARIERQRQIAEVMNPFLAVLPILSSTKKQPATNPPAPLKTMQWGGYDTLDITAGSKQFSVTDKDTNQAIPGIQITSSDTSIASVGIFTVSGGFFVHPLRAGSFHLSFTAPDYQPLTTTDITVTVPALKGNDVTGKKASDSFNLTELFPAIATGTDFTYTITPAGYARVIDWIGHVTIDGKASGTITITATNKTTGESATAHILNVVGGSPKITAKNAKVTLQEGETTYFDDIFNYEFSASGDYSYHFTDTTLAHATILGITAYGSVSGKTTITATLKTDPTVTASFELTVTGASTSTDEFKPILNPFRLNVGGHQYTDLLFTSNFGNLTTVQVTSSDPSIAVVRDGKVEALKPGTATITGTLSAVGHQTQTTSFELIVT
ncbi:carboxypeptidase-like regulatory domain-containing protein [Citrobacter portucalensis]|uniref:carboxypeptidase-like regulatory domain-containing protein n=1 Tax=Citrobacter portucalensis TaxID=1639133 RepID=UPI00226B4017|nr:carboxypeptidase-like regulatory domain-containing protein [Citrobacter portucalensis]MCX9047066.1 carboxypeptidase-like regulatory domain-containing protein [Citrobacter portucalensis]